jgi:hypothetical protein
MVKNGNVTLEGVVANETDRAKAQAGAEFAGTYFALTNNLAVENPPLTTWLLILTNCLIFLGGLSVPEPARVHYTRKAPHI